MSLKLKREILEKIVYEELTNYIAQQLNEAPVRGTALDDEEPSGELPDPDAAPEEQLPDTSPAPEAGDEPGEPEELPTGEEPTDDDLEADAAGEESSAEPGTLAAELEGKSIKSVSMEEESKIMPGAAEVVLSFREVPDALRLLISKTGKVKIFYKGLHNDFTSFVEEVPGEDEEMELGDEEEAGPEQDVTGGEDLEDMGPMGDEDMPPEEDEEESV